MKDETVYYFAYGSNMSTARLIGRGVDVLSSGKGILDHWHLVFNKKSYRNREYGFANIEPQWGNTVNGVLHEVGGKDLPKLDKFEGYPKHYQRTVLTVLDIGESGPRTISAVVYIANRKWTTSLPLKMSEDYASHIREGLLEHDIDENYRIGVDNRINEMIDNG